MKKITWDSINNIQYYSKGHFFDKEAIRFFNSRLPSGGFNNGNEIYFVTSERFDSNTPCMYTVRKLTIKTGSIDTVEFQQYKTKKTAEKYAEILAKA